MTSKKTMGPGDYVNYQHDDQYGSWLGYKVINVDRDQHEAKVELIIRKDHLSPAGRVHGGVITGLFDFACGAAVFSTMKREDFCSTVEIKVNFFKPLELGDKLMAIAKVAFRGKRLCVLNAFLYRSGEEAPVAMASATFYVVSKQ